MLLGRMFFRRETRGKDAGQKNFLSTVRPSEEEKKNVRVDRDSCRSKINEGEEKPAGHKIKTTFSARI